MKCFDTNLSVKITRGSVFLCYIYDHVSGFTDSLKSFYTKLTIINAPQVIVSSLRPHDFCELPNFLITSISSRSSLKAVVST